MDSLLELQRERGPAHPGTHGPTSGLQWPVGLTQFPLPFVPCTQTCFPPQHTLPSFSMACRVKSLGSKLKTSLPALATNPTPGPLWGREAMFVPFA